MCGLRMADVSSFQFTRLLVAPEPGAQVLKHLTNPALHTAEGFEQGDLTNKILLVVVV